jgi:phosphate transport system protein
MSVFRHFDLELAELKRSLVEMGNLVEDMLALSVGAILAPNHDARDRAEELEERVDAAESAIEERCHQLIALQSPRARDLRFLISATRIASDLEQVADLAESIARRADYIVRHSQVPNPPELEPLGALARRMVNQALEAFVTGNLGVARHIHDEERQADERTRDCYHAIQAAMQEHPALIKEYTHLLRAVGHLEHTADIAVSIADEAVYIHRGDLVRHQHDTEAETR